MVKHVKAALVVLIISWIFLPATPAFAHLMLIEPVEEGKVQVVFDDGSIARHAEVVVYDDEGEEIARGDVDEEGKFHYPPENADLIVADDGFGHRAEHAVGEDPGEALPRGLTVAVVLSGFALIAGVFHYRVKKKRAQVYDE